MYLVNRNKSHTVNWEYVYYRHLEIFFSLSNTKHQMHMEIIGNFYFHSFQMFVPGRYCVSSGHQLLNDQSSPSAV